MHHHLLTASSPLLNSSNTRPFHPSLPPPFFSVGSPCVSKSNSIIVFLFSYFFGLPKNNVILLVWHISKWTWENEITCAGGQRRRDLMQPNAMNPAQTAARGQWFDLPIHAKVPRLDIDLKSLIAVRMPFSTIFHMWLELMVQLVMGVSAWNWGWDRTIRGVSYQNRISVMGCRFFWGLFSVFGIAIYTPKTGG